MLRTLTVTAVILMAAPAMAQNPPQAPRTTPPVQVAPPSAAAPPEKIAPPSRDLSNRLSQQRGTIDPPNVDPNMTVHPPAQSGGTTPVIPPPGSPGGNPSVVPK
jgi:hypothetical protein